MIEPGPGRLLTDICPFLKLARLLLKDPSPIIALPCKPFSCYIDFFKLLYGFVKIDTWISLSCYVDLSNLLHGLVKVISWICFSLFFLLFAKQNQAEV